MTLPKNRSRRPPSKAWDGVVVWPQGVVEDEVGDEAGDGEAWEGDDGNHHQPHNTRVPCCGPHQQFKNWNDGRPIPRKCIRPFQTRYILDDRLHIRMEPLST